MQLGFNFKSAKARRSDPETSKQAAISLDPTETETLVLEVIRLFPEGCIFDDILRELPTIREGSISPRLKPLTKKGLIEETGELRKGKSGRNQRVLRCVKI
jgi:DNA-binding HxlR family transcriptional regulator